MALRWSALSQSYQTLEQIPAAARDKEMEKEQVLYINVAVKRLGPVLV